MSKRDIEICESGRCPYCLEKTRWRLGPRANLSQNVKCGACDGILCISPGTIEKIEGVHMKPQFTLRTEIMKGGKRVGTREWFIADVDVAIVEFRKDLEDGNRPTLREFRESDNRVVCRVA